MATGAGMLGIGQKHGPLVALLLLLFNPLTTSPSTNGQVPLSSYMSLFVWIPLFLQ
jgi:hypothetical protein